MYSKTQEVSIPPVEEVVISDGTQTELELIKQKTKSQLELLKKQTERLELFDAKIDIDFAIKWYEIRSSQFSKLAYFYGQKGWFDRQVLHGEVVAGAIVLGLAVHALAFFAVVGAYYKLSEILSDHYNVEEANKEAIRKSFDGLKEELKQSIETFNEMECKLDEAFNALEEQTVSLSTTIAQLGIEAGKLHSQVVRLEGMVKQLQEQQQKMLVTSGKLSDAGEKLSSEIASLSVVITERKTALDLMTATIVAVAQGSVKTEKKITEDTTSVSKLSQELFQCFDASVVKIKECEERFSESGATKKCRELDSELEAGLKIRNTSSDSQARAQRILASCKKSSLLVNRAEEKTEDMPSPFVLR